MLCLRVCICWLYPLQTPNGAKAVSSAKRVERETGLDWAEEILVTKVDIEESNAARAELQVGGEINHVVPLCAWCSQFTLASQ